MIYAMSDLHGCYDKYIKMLNKISFSDSDTLYILGDVVDRGDGGIKLLQDMCERKNAITLRGNHDYLACYLLKALCFNADISFADNITDKFNMWLYDGGAPTYDAFTALTPKEQNKIIAYLNTFLIYDEVYCGGNNFFLAHTVPEKKRMEQFDKLLWQEFITGEPEYEKEYSPNKYIVTGHTPTGFIDKAYKGRVYRKNNHIAIDCGAVFGNPLGCICLDTLEEFYTE